MQFLHKISGLLLIFIFVLTGQYMDKFYNHLEGMDDGLRMFFRSRHIYILLCALINLGLGTYVVINERAWRKILQISGSIFILTASLLFVTAFFLETRELSWQTNFARYGIYIITAGVIFHFIATIRKEKNQFRQNFKNPIN